MAKKTVYAEIPVFDQETEYIVQLEPVENEGFIYYGVEIKKMELDNNIDEQLFV